MAKARDCLEFDRLWNDRLDDGGVATEADPRGRAMAEHSADCDRCRSREAVFAEVEAALTSPALAPLATPEAIARWVAAASAACPPAAAPAAAAASRDRPTRRRRRLALIGCRLGRAVAIAASTLVATNLALPILYPVEPPPPAPHGWALPTPFEEACAEASTMAQDLVVSVSAPASRLGSDALGMVEPGPPPSRPAQDELAAAEAPPANDPIDPAKVELISGSAKHAFRFLTGSTTDESEDPEIIGGS